MAQSGLVFLGKLFIIASLGFQAFLLYQDKNQSSTFDKNLKAAMSTCHCFTPQIQQLAKQHLRLVVAGLLASSILFLFIRSWILKFPTLIGLIVLLWIEQHQVFTVVPTLAILQNTALFHSLGVIGAIIYLLGAQCSSCSNPQKQLNKARQQVSQNTRSNIKERSSNDKKRN